MNDKEHVRESNYSTVSHSRDTHHVEIVSSRLSYDQLAKNEYDDEYSNNSLCLQATLTLSLHAKPTHSRVDSEGGSTFVLEAPSHVINHFGEQSIRDTTYGSSEISHSEL
jgi:hypothetical protein